MLTISFVLVWYIWGAERSRTGGIVSAQGAGSKVRTTLAAASVLVVLPFATLATEAHAASRVKADTSLNCWTAHAYLTERFNGVPPTDTCGLPDNGGVIPASPVPAEPIPPPLP